MSMANATARLKAWKKSDPVSRMFGCRGPVIKDLLFDKKEAVLRENSVFLLLSQRGDQSLRLQKQVQGILNILDDQIRAL